MLEVMYAYSSPVKTVNVTSLQRPATCIVCMQVYKCICIRRARNNLNHNMYMCMCMYVYVYHCIYMYVNTYKRTQTSKNITVKSTHVFLVSTTAGQNLPS